MEWRPSPSALHDRSILTFAHHVLFDYSVARLLLRGSDSVFLNRLAGDSEFSIVARPSVDLHFRHLWFQTHTRDVFWASVFSIARDTRIHGIAKLIGPSVAAELAGALEDLKPLVDWLGAHEEGRREVGEAVLRHIVGALLAIPSMNTRLVGPDAGPWSGLLEILTRELESKTAYVIRPILCSSTDKPDSLTTEQLRSLGLAARRLLTYAWSKTPRDTWLTIHSLQAVCRTYESDKTAANQLLKQALDSNHIKSFGYEELPWIARECRRLALIDPDFVEAVYTSTFSYTESSRVATSMGSGRILSLTSTPQQEIDSAYYELAEHFEEFLKVAPAQATHTLINVLSYYIKKTRQRSTIEASSPPFEFLGFQVHLKTDYSSIWDEGEERSLTHELRMLGQFAKRLEYLGSEPRTLDRALELIRLVAEKCDFAAIWRRALLVGAKHPKTLGSHLFPLASSLGILLNFDTTVPAGALLKSTFALMPPEARREVEEAILSIPKALADKNPEISEHARNRLLGCLTREAIITEGARSLVEQLETTNAIPPNRPTITIGPITSKAFREEDWLREKGVPTDQDQNRRILELEKPIQEFASKYLNASPQREAIEKILDNLTALESALATADTDGVHPEQREYAFRTLFSACVRIARSSDLATVPKASEFALRLLVQASNHPLPEYDAEAEARFDETPSWGVEPRIEAAAGLVLFCRDRSYLKSALGVVKSLAQDPVSAVRFQIVSGLLGLYQTAPEEMWQLLEQCVIREKSSGVLQGLIGSVIGPLCGPHLERVFNLVEAILTRTETNPRLAKVRVSCLDLVAGAYLWRNLPRAKSRIDQILERLLAVPEDAQSCIQNIRDPISVSPKRPPREGYLEVRRRAFELLLAILKGVTKGIGEIRDRNANRSSDAWTEEDKKNGRALAQIADGIASDLYFASGFADKSVHSEPREEPLAPKQKQFYEEAEPLLDELAALSIPSVTHHLLQMLEPYIDLDPKGVFLRVANTVKAGSEGGYQYESLALEFTVKLVEEFLADQRQLLRDDNECRNSLLELLEIFVQVGWPAARRLTYRLQEIFR